MSKSVARERQVEVRVKDEKGRVVRDEAGAPVQTGIFETVRTATCWEHEKQTTNFQGVNAHGWLFRCPGLNESDVAGTKFRPTPWHYFVATPADGE